MILGSEDAGIFVAVFQQVKKTQEILPGLLRHSSIKIYQAILVVEHLMWHWVSNVPTKPWHDIPMIPVDTRHPHQDPCGLLVCLFCISVGWMWILIIAFWVIPDKTVGSSKIPYLQQMTRFWSMLRWHSVSSGLLGGGHSHGKLPINQFCWCVWRRNWTWQI